MFVETYLTEKRKILPSEIFTIAITDDRNGQ